MKIFNFDDYKEYLGRVLEERNNRNPSYTLRAFSRDLGISPSRLSEILSNKGNLSARSAAKIADRLNFSEDEKAYLIGLIRPDRSTMAVKLRQTVDTSKHENLNFTTFTKICKWYHLAIWNLFFIEKIQSTDQVLAHFPELAPEDIHETIKLFVRYDLLEVHEGFYQPIKEKISFFYDFKSEDIQKYHLDFIDLAKQSVTQVDVDHRFLYNLIFPMSRANRNLINDRIRKFVQDFTDEIKPLRDTQENDCLYAMNLQAFPIAYSQSQDQSSPPESVN